jgi:phosphoribosylformylglycinamidine synthase
VLTDTPERLESLSRAGRVPLRYVGPDGRPTGEWPWNPNGSPAGVASLTDASGRVFGLMPHPDAFLHPWHHPDWRRQGSRRLADRPTGLAMFASGLEAARDLV